MLAEAIIGPEGSRSKVSIDCFDRLLQGSGVIAHSICNKAWSPSHLIVSQCIPRLSFAAVSRHVRRTYGESSVHAIYLPISDLKIP